MLHAVATINHEDVIDASEGQDVTLALPQVAGGEDFCYAVWGASVAFTAHQSIPFVLGARINNGTSIPLVGIVVSPGRMIDLEGMKVVTDEHVMDSLWSMG